MPIPADWHPRWNDFRVLLDLAVPVVVVQIGMMLMGVVDTLMVGRLSPEALAAVALGNLYGMAVMLLAQGILLAIDPLVAQAVGAGDHSAIARDVQRALVLAVALTLPVSVFLLFGGPALAALGQPPVVVPLADGYARLLIPGIFPFLAFGVGRQALQALGRLRPVVTTILVANVVNIGLNWALIFGRFGFPALGVAGSAIATSASRWLMVAVLAGLGWKDLRHYLHPWLPESLAPAALARMARLGLPIGLQFELEFSAFGGVALLAGGLGTIPMASHQIAINLASLTYMVPLGISAAAAVLVGRAVGRGNATEARRQAVTALLSGAGFMVGTALLFLAVPGALARFYSSDAGVVALAGALIPLAGVFQVFDGIQVTAIGVLRGVGDTRTPFLVTLMGYWAIGMPFGMLLGLRLGLGAAGLWWGLVAGLGAVAGILLFRVRRILSGPLARTFIDSPPPEAEAGVHSFPMA
jgi:MATE family multidrug resistance protein